MSLVPKKIFFDDFFDDFMPTTKTMDMKCDIYEEGKNYIIELDAPGFDKKDISIDVDNKYLTISANHESSEDESDRNYIRKERSYTNMSRSFYIGSVDEKDIKANFKDGILKVVVPKEEKVDNKKKIEIE